MEGLPPPPRNTTAMLHACCQVVWIFFHVVLVNGWLQLCCMLVVKLFWFFFFLCPTRWRNTTAMSACWLLSCVFMSYSWSGSSWPWPIHERWLLLIAILRFRADSLRSHVILHERIAFYSAFSNIHRSGVLTALTWLVPHETAAVSVRSVYTIIITMHHVTSCKATYVRCMRV